MEYTHIHDDVYIHKYGLSIQISGKECTDSYGSVHICILYNHIKCIYKFKGKNTSKK